MSYGIELRGTNGKVQMSADHFGLMVADIFDVAPGASGSKTYSDLSWHNNIYAQGITNIAGDIYSRTIASHAFVDLNITVNANNIPTISWSENTSATACVGGGSNDTDYYKLQSGTKFKKMCKSGDRRPDIRIIVMAG